MRLTKELPSDWRTKRLVAVAKLISGGTPSRKVPEYFWGDIPWITGNDVVSFRTSKAREYITEEAIENSATHLLPKGSILFVTRTGVGKVSIADVDICISQDLTGVICKEDIALPEYVARYLISLSEKIKYRQRGSTIKGVTREFVEQIEIPLPPVPVQKKIAAILDKADAAREKRRQANQLTEQFLQSAFLEMFGDPVTNPKEWDLFKLRTLGTLGRGKSKHRPRNAAELLGGLYPLIQTGDVANSFGYVKEYKQTYSELGLKQSKLWPKGTLCITIAANIAKTGILTFDACFPDSIVGFIPNCRTNTEFIQQWFSFVQKHLEDTAPMSAQKNINLEILKNLKVTSPPFDLQKKFAALVGKVESLRARQRQSGQELETLFNSLMQRAFKGDL